VGETKPAILTVDDDPAVSQAIARDLRRRYGADYQVVRASSGAGGLDALAQLAQRQRRVAMIVSDQRMPSMTGIDLLSRAREHAPGTKLVLLTAYADTEVAIRAINDIGLDHYLLKPWDPPDERLYPVVDDLLADWRAQNPDDRDSDVRVLGHRWSERAHELKTFLARNHVPYRWLDVEADADASRLKEAARVADADLPVVLVPDRDPLRSPSTLELASALGLRTTAEQPLYDLCIVGGGPAGLAAAVYGASEGLQTVVVEREAPGGQAGQSAAIENYLGFPAASREPTSPTGPSPRRAGSAPSWCSPARSPASRHGDRSGPWRWATEARSRPAPCSWRPACRTACSRPTGYESSRAGGCTTGPRPATPRRAGAATCTGWARRTRPVRRPSTSPATRSGWSSSCAATRWRARCRPTSRSASARPATWR